MKIKMLNNETINKIAAGEVIIRPVSVVKELVENAIDAGASHILVMIEAGGKNQIIIRDNGCGIAYNEIPLAFKRHATSKLATIEDLETINSLGFRGEALSSVSAVARVQVTTRNEDEEVGSRTAFEGGTLINQRVCSYNQGTEVKVWDLFYNTPARRKHLEKDKKEEGLIRNLMNKIALSHPEIAFQIKCNGRIVLDTNGSGKVIDVVNVLYGWEVGSNLIPLDYENSPMKLGGFIGNLKMMRSHREDQIFFINGRYVRNLRLAQALDEAYAGYTMKHQHPFGIVFMELPGRMLDVNIHPAKTEIKIQNESLISLLFKQGIRETLRGSNLVVNIGAGNDQIFDRVRMEKDDENREKAFSDSDDRVAIKKSENQKQEMFLADAADPVIKKDAKIKSHQAQLDQQHPVAMNPEKAGRQCEDRPQKADQETSCKIEAPLAKTMINHNSSGHVSEKTEIFSVTEKAPIRQNELLPDLSKMRIVGQLFNGYVLLEGIKEIYLIDQHAAHEAFLTQELEEIFKSGGFIASQGLMTPIPIKIRPKDLDSVRNALPFYRKIGYECDVFGEDSLLVRSVPVLLGEPQTIELLKSVIDENLCDRDERHRDSENVISSKIKHKLISMACKAAIKGGQSLTHEEIKQLLADLMGLENPFTCPHGRPVITRLKEYELMKLFKRVI
ncbi:DNA mismatch repair endonuclease MutL [Acetobacterium fimetarium]|uniref:DNA mismatch repair protein MutL n=2 Tax=Acetobacterium fimetarium TaxID=52691 RepID=A0ABR6WVR6_9FIRM|nr:DNA mismatch repair endonuclease MutL [Acetobacterium fimetarium]